MYNLILVEDNPKLRLALKTGLEAESMQVVDGCASGEEALAYCLEAADKITKDFPDVALMDVQLAGEMNGIQAAVAIRREFPRFPVVFYSIQDDDQYYRDFRRSGILSHYAYVRKSNYLLPQMIIPLLKDAMAGRSFIDPEIESRVQEVRVKDENDPMTLLEPHEQAVAEMVARGLTNEQIAVRMGFRDKRTISRINGQIYLAWGLADTATDEKVARTRAALAVSLFNTITLLWLGLTVLLNAERRTLGLWVSGGMLLLGSVFFLSHSAILGHGSDLFSQGINFWWHLGWFPVVYLPLAWYAVMLWYSGYWSHPQSRLHLRHRAWFWLVVSLSIGGHRHAFYRQSLAYLPKAHPSQPGGDTLYRRDSSSGVGIYRVYRAVHQPVVGCAAPAGPIRAGDGEHRTPARPALAGLCRSP
jgi:DNA-binding NarL/FixJ family response regulator